MPDVAVLARPAVARFDDRVDAAFDVLRGRRLVDRVFYSASELADFSLIWFILGGVRALRSEPRPLAAGRLALALGLESILVNGVIKSLVRRTRPQPAVERPLHLRIPRTSSFPSGHATSAFSAAALLSQDDSWWPLYYGVAAVVAGSRVHVRIHHASDVVAGVALGVALGSLMRRIVPLPPPTGQGVLEG